jgi:anti-sigma regulatory factor (Ser/Thr protein kinase)
MWPVAEGVQLEAMAVRSDPQRFRDVRRWVSSAMEDAGYGARAAHDLAIAVNEACANIHRHAYQGRSDGRIELEMEIGAESLRMRIRDYGGQLDLAGYCPPDLAEPSEGGYGLFLMEALTDHIEFSSSATGTEVLMEKYYPGRSARKAG